MKAKKDSPPVAAVEILEFGKGTNSRICRWDQPCRIKLTELYLSIGAERGWSVDGHRIILCLLFANKYFY